MKPKIFKTFLKKGKRYIVFPRYPGYSILDDDGNNYGSFSDIKSFTAKPERWESLGKAYLELKPISDGFVSSWSENCPQCGGDSMEVVRPGKVQCSNCNGGEYA